LNFRTIADLNATILRNLHRIPSDVDAVVGVPRSGLMAGSLVALALNLPLADVVGFAEGRLLASGKTRTHRGLHSGFEALRHVLVVDDSARTGSAMSEARRMLTEACPDKRFTFCAIYGLREVARELDFVFEIVADPRIFQWNVMHHGLLGNACVDIDGVLCRDPQDHENDDGEAYLRFLSEVAPLHRPTQTIGALVTSRLEKYRPQTEGWLRSHGVAYQKLVMLDLPDMASRRRLNAHGSFKAEYYRKSDATLFIESELSQAETIVRVSGKPVLCMDGPIMLSPGMLSLPAAALRIRSAPRRYAGRIKKLARIMLGETAYGRLKAMLKGGYSKPF
jgi:uncharacterized HAD superfamily protein/hypoxanthine phosphoribosyltransferase